MASRITFKAPKDYDANAFDKLVLAINQRLDETAASLRSADSTINPTLPIITTILHNLVIGRGTWFELTVVGSSAGLTGLTGGEAGRIIVIKNAAGSANSLLLVHNSSSSSEGNRFVMRGAANLTIPINGAHALVYSNEVRGWVPISEVP